MLGMYVHTHWSYHHPYAARKWSLSDWQDYLHGLKSLGYDFVMIWPLIDFMPEVLTPSDTAFLQKIAKVIDYAHGMDMKVAITVGPNIIGNEHASEYPFEDRPYFICEHKTNLRDSADRRLLLKIRRQCYALLHNIDYLVMIDSDPGGMPGSTNHEFVELMRDQLAAAREFNPKIEMVYWMWVGWENYNRFWDETAKWKEGDPDVELHWDEESFLETMELMRQDIPEPWSVFACNHIHFSAVKQKDLGNKVLFFPYGAVEGEPTFPLINHQPGFIAECVFSVEKPTYPRGIMCNAQTHCLQLPGTYQFAHFAQGGTAENLDLAGFGDKLFPGHGELLAHAWRLVEGRDISALRSAAGQIEALAANPPKVGPASGLLFGSPQRFLSDLADNLKIRASLAEFHAAAAAARKEDQLERSPIQTALRQLLPVLKPYVAKTGYVDAYGGPLYSDLNESLKGIGDPAVELALHQFNDWRNPLVRNGVFQRLLTALDAYVAT